MEVVDPAAVEKAEKLDDTGANAAAQLVANGAEKAAEKLEPGSDDAHLLSPDALLRDAAAASQSAAPPVKQQAPALQALPLQQNAKQSIPSPGAKPPQQMRAKTPAAAATAPLPPQQTLPQHVLSRAQLVGARGSQTPKVPLPSATQLNKHSGLAKAAAGAVVGGGPGGASSPAQQLQLQAAQVQLQAAHAQVQATQQQQPSPTNPEGKVKRGRGGRRAGAGRKRKADALAKDEAGTSSGKTQKQGETSATSGGLSAASSASSSSSSSAKPAKKKKLYEELNEGLKNTTRQLKFGYTILYVKEVEKTVEFYERAFGLKRRFVHESKQYAEMDTGVTALSFASNELAKSNLTPVEFRPNEPTQLPPGMEIAFSSFDVQRDYKRAVDAGARSVSAPKVLPWGQVVAYVRDLNGVLVEIASEMKMKT